MKGVLGNMVLDQPDHCDRRGELTMALNLSFPSLPSPSPGLALTWLLALQET